MKIVKFAVTEEQFTYLKHVIGFDNIEGFFRPTIDRAMSEDIKHERNTTVTYR